MDDRVVSCISCVFLQDLNLGSPLSVLFINKDHSNDQ